MWLLIDRWGLLVIPWSLTISAAIETVLLAYVLWMRIQRRARAPV